MSLDGLRAWIGLVERKLTMRTRVFLVLVAIAIGGAAVGIVLAVDAQNNTVSKDDLQAVRDELAGTSAPTEAPQAARMEGEIEALRGEIAALRNEAPAGKAEGATKPGSGSGGESGGASSGGEGGSESGSASAQPSDQKKLREAGEEAIEEAQGKDHNK
jgi:uncharacterized membrane protein YgcG